VSAGGERILEVLESRLSTGFRRLDFSAELHPANVRNATSASLLA
jgi:hypothetical protein